MSELNIAELFENDENMRPLTELIHSIIELPDEQLNETTIPVVMNAVNTKLSTPLKSMSINAILNSFAEQNLDIDEAENLVAEMKEATLQYVKTLQPSDIKQQFLNQVFEIFFELFDQALIQYDGYDIVLPIQLDDNAKVPTYAHNDDAAADLYANETVVIKAHSLGNLVHTGVKFALPTGWKATILPRSSTGLKTPLRLSNSQGLIDSSYRGEIMLLFDNISDSDFTIKQGDRLAQLEVEPVHRFKPKIVEALDETERGEGGFGSTGN